MSNHFTSFAKYTVRTPKENGLLRFLLRQHEKTGGKKKKCSISSLIYNLKELENQEVLSDISILYYFKCKVMGDRDFEFLYVEIFKIVFFMKLLTKELNFLVI